MPGKRNIAFLLAVFLLFACFLSLYYFYYIPSQRSALHQYGFSLLRRIQTNVQTGNTNLRRLYGTSVRKLQQKENDLALQEQLKRLTPAGTMLPEPVHVDTLVEKRAGEPIPLTDTSAYFMYAGAWQIVYPIYDAIHTRIVEVSTPISSLLDPCLGYRKEFFEGFLLVNTGQQSGIVLYGGEEFGMLEKLNGDSLLLLQKGGGFPQITDVALKGVPYKLFAWSVMLERQEVILCGVVKESTYHAQINTIPVKIVYPVIILLLLLVLGLPFLKLYFMNRKETLRSRDFTLGAISVAIGMAMIALIIVHVLLLMRSDKEIAGGLRKLSGQIENSLQHELEMAGDQMAFFDRQLDSAVAGKRYPPGQPLLELRKETGSVYHIPWWDSALSNGKVKTGRDNTYAYFNRMSWIDREGKQTLKVQIDEPWSIKFIKVSDRRYYQAFKGNRPDDTLLLAMEPVNSWTNGDFEINLSIRSRTAYQVLAMSTHLYSLQQVIMSSGYSYCLMDSAGSMYTHSDLRKALKDNFIEETGARRPVLEAIAGHQDTVLRNILLYSRPHSIFIHPLKSSSLFLVTMYDESYYIAVHLRILAFALLCLPVCAALVILGMLVLYWIPNRHVLFSPAEYAQWMLPRSGLRPYYKAGCLFMVLYQALFWLWLNGADAYLLFFIGCLTPLNVLAVLAALRSYYNTILKQEQDILHIRIVAIIVLQGAGTLAVGYCAGIPVGAGWSFFLFQACVCALALVLTDRKGRVEQLYYSLFPVSPPWRFNRFGRILRQISWWPVWRWMNWDYLYWHAIFIFLLTQCISSLPAILFTWYAQNHEIRQSVKKEQLYLASKLQNRKPSIYHFLQSHDVNVVSHRYIDTIAYARGIYTLYDEKVSRPAIGAAQVTRQDAAILNNKAENFYLEMVNGIIANKKDPLNYPALRNLSSDRQWSWDNRLKDTLEFLWHPSREAMFARKDTTVDPLLIRSKMPDRYVMVQRPVIKFLLMVIGFLIAYGIIALIRMTIYRFFSLRFVHWQEKGRAAGSPFPPIRDSEFLQQCYDRNRYLEKIETGGHACLRDYFRAGYSRNDGRLSTNKAEIMEAQIMKQADSCKVFFGELWKSCSNEDKLLLMNLAQYGVVNYKNTEGIFRLLKRELVIVYDGRIHLLSPAFRYFILNRSEQPEEQELRKQSLKAGRWQQVRMVLLLLMLLTGIFLFITQEEAFKRVGAVLTSVTGVVSLLMKFVSDASPAKK